MAISDDGGRIALRMAAPYDIATATSSTDRTGARLLVLDTRGQVLARVPEVERSSFSAAAFVTASRLLAVRESPGVDLRHTFVEIDLDSGGERRLVETKSSHGVRIGLDVARRRALLIGKEHRLRILDLGTGADLNASPQERLTSGDAAILDDGRVAYAFATGSGAWLSILGTKLQSIPLGPPGTQISLGIGGQPAPARLTVSLTARDFSSQRTALVDLDAGVVTHMIEGATVVGGAPAHMFPGTPALPATGSPGSRLLRNGEGRLLSLDPVTGTTSPAPFAVLR
jgi:hypothetical protein